MLFMRLDYTLVWEKANVAEFGFVKFWRCGVWCEEEEWGFS